MDALKKKQAEQKIVIVMLLAFGAVLFNALKSTGMLGGRPLSKPAAVVATAAKTLPDIVKTYREKMEIPAALAANVVAAKAQEVSNPEEPFYQAQSLRDPLENQLPKAPEVDIVDAALAQPLPPEPVQQMPMPVFSIQGLLWGGPNPQAIINGKLCRVGGQVDGAVIKAITRDGVELEFGGRTVLLSMANAPSRGR